MHSLGGWDASSIRPRRRVVDRSVSCRGHIDWNILSPAGSAAARGFAGQSARLHESSQVQQQQRPIGTAHRVIANGGRRMLRPAILFFPFLFHAFFPFSFTKEGEDRAKGKAVRSIGPP